MCERTDPASAANPITEDRALEIVLAAQNAWNRRDLRALAACYTEDLTYWTNWGGPDNGPRTFTGRQEYIRNLAALRDMTDITIRLASFVLAGDQGRALFDFEWRDPQTRLGHTASSRNVITFRDDRIARLEVYQDKEAMQAFQQLIASNAALTQR